ncbi:Protein big brotherlike, partial [Caligus rogercresseyi]
KGKYTQGIIMIPSGRAPYSGYDHPLNIPPHCSGLLEGFPNESSSIPFLFQEWFTTKGKSLIRMKSLGETVGSR